MKNESVRKSNIELLRIVSMFMILTHHYVVNSGIMEGFGAGSTSINYIFLALFGMWGKTGINIFIMISGYFMCRSKLTVKRYCKVLFEYLFYLFVIYFTLLFMGYEVFNVARINDLLFGVFKYANVSGNFLGSFFMFYLFIPFINKFIHQLTKAEFRNLILLLLFVFTILSTVFFNIFVFGEIFWFIAIYLIGAYLKLYPPTWANSLKASRNLLILSLIVSYASVVLMVIKEQFMYTFYFVIDANKLGAVLVSIFMFTTFKNINIGYSRFINLIAKTAFGVLLIHANSDAMRRFMWRDLLHVDTFYSLPLTTLIIKSLFICCGIFVVCSILDMIRIYLFEEPLFKNFEPIEKMIIKTWSAIKKLSFNVYKYVIGFVE
jgi:brp/blh family beta-carotene 15,15'-monooxygenase